MLQLVYITLTQTMKTCFHIASPDGMYAAAIIDLVPYYNDDTNKMIGYYITRINVLPQFRGQGYGRQVLKLLLYEADRNNVTLFLEIMPDDGFKALSFHELKAWYTRHGFKPWHGIYAYRRKKS